MSSSRDRALSIIELLAGHMAGLPLSVIADRLDIPRSATHRLLNDLKDTGYVRQDGEGGHFSLTVKIVALGLSHLTAANFNNLVQPVLERLARLSGELVMLSVIEGDRLMRVAKVQGARQGLQYNPVEGPELYLAGSANGHAWLSCLADDQALQLLARQGIRPGYGPNAPKTVAEAMERVRRARARDYAVGCDQHEVGISAVAAVIRSGPAGQPVATMSIAGPTLRLAALRLDELSTDLLAATRELSIAARQSSLFQYPQNSAIAKQPAEAA
jgi:IclR family transcriptional regulator, acetate operon repressor